MTDADAAYIEILRRQSPSQKVAAIHQLRRTAWDLKAAWIRRSEPELSESEVQDRVRQVFLRAVVEEQIDALDLGAEWANVRSRLSE